MWRISAVPDNCFSPDSHGVKQTDDPDQTRQLLRAAGYADGLPVRLITLYAVNKAVEFVPYVSTLHIVADSVNQRLA
jgi:hypothetical protein